MAKKKLLSITHSALAKEWHPTKNGDLTPDDITYGSGKKVWWICNNNHEYEAIIGNRARLGTGCTYCAGKKVGYGNDLQTNYPEVAKEWHPQKNGLLKPTDITPMSNIKVWWICQNMHSYKADSAHRLRGRGCPYCSGFKVGYNNDLESLFPIIAKEWHPTKNTLNPHEVTPGSGKKVWWLCNKGHAWEISPHNRTGSGKSGCPYCSNHKVGYSNDLQSIYPNIAEEWHPTKNKGLLPTDFTSHSGKKVWWLCKNKHAYYSTIDKRTRDDGDGTGCPKCTNKTSRQQILIYSELQYLFDKVTDRKNINNREIDIYIDDIELGIEYDGFYWHKDKYQDDKEKKKGFINNDINVLNIRENGLKQISDNDIMLNSGQKGYKLIEPLLKYIISLDIIEDRVFKKISNYLIDGELKNKELFNKLVSYLPGPLPGRDLKSKFPEVAKEWHPNKNGNLKPDQMFFGTSLEVWWLCNKGHDYKSRILTRTNLKSGCPYCSGQKIGYGNDLYSLYPKIAREWHPTKNTLNPHEVTPGSGKKVWWLCSKGHEFESYIQPRVKRGIGCAYCSKKRSGYGNDLESKFPEVAKEWHPTKNGELTANKVAPRIHKKYWWLCSKGHEFESAISSRTVGKSGCPYCVGKLASVKHNLLFNFPKVAEEWHPTNNGTLNPEDITPKSGKRVWWLCKSKHEYQAVVYNRTGNNSGCPYCAGNRKK